MDQYSVFNNYSDAEFEEMRKCLSGEKRIFAKNDVIMRHSNSENNIGIINKGVAFLLSISEDGEKGIIDYYEKGCVFGKSFAPDCEINLFYVLAKEKCEVTFFSYDSLMNCCTENCNKHRKIISNIIMNSFRRSQMHIDILSCRSIKGKLSTYFRYMKHSKNSDKFEIPVSLSDLADYLSVDRSAMMREIKKMKDQNLIDSKGSQITIIDL